MTEPSNQEKRPQMHEVPLSPTAALRRDGFFLDVWWIEPRRNRIVSDKTERRLDPRVMEVLVHLATRAGEVVSRDELSIAVWKDNFVGENTVSQAVSRLRKALGDDSQRPRFIETISKSGYRLVAEIRPGGDEAGYQAAASGDGVSVGDRRGGSTAALRMALLAVAVLAAGVVGSWLWSGRSSSPPAVATVVPELTVVGSQFEPVLSPLGDKVAFCWRNDDEATFSVWVQEVGGDNPVRLTDPETHERLPAWSPDGRSIVFVRFSTEGEPLGIYRQAIIGGPAERLSDGGQGIRSLHLSPDNTTLVLSIRHSNDAPTQIETLDIETGATRVLATPPDGVVGDRNPMFSPDGKQIAFERRRNRTQHDVMVVATAGGEPTRLTSDRWGQMRGLDWASDGSAVLYASNRSGQFALWQVPTGGGEPTQLPIHDTWITQPSVSRSGDRLIYRTFRDVMNIWSLPLAADGAVAGEPVVQVPSTRSERHPEWSPNGGAIAFLSDRSGSTELWSGKPDGTDLMRHTDLSGPVPGSPCWSHDGASLLFDVADDGHSDLWLVDRESRSPTRLTSEPSEERNGTFSRDGRWVYFASDRSGEWQVWRIPTSGGAASAVTETGGFLAQESVDGDQLYFVTLDEPGIRRMPVAGGEAEVVLPGLDLSDWGNWVVGETGIYYVRRNPTTIEHIRFSDGAVHAVYTPSGQLPYLGRCLSLSSDGRSLLFAMIERSDDEVMRVDLPGL